MSWIVVKHPIIVAQALDGHQVLAPNLPPIPPPIGAPIPTWPYFVPHHIPGAHLIWGKWTDQSASGEGQGMCLWQHDWGIGQIHITVPTSAAALLILLGSCLKLQLPCSSVQERATGGSLAAGDVSKAAAALPCGFIVAQSCWDAAGLGFVLPTGLHFSSPSSISCSVRLGDIGAAAFAMGADAMTQLSSSMFGRRIGGVGGTAMGLLMGSVARSKPVVAYLAAMTLTPWDQLQAARARSRVTPNAPARSVAARRAAAAEGRATATSTGTLLSAGSAVADWASERVQGHGPDVP